MRNNNIKGLLKIPGYKIKDIQKTEHEIHIQIEAYKPEFFSEFDLKPVA
jgi:hypothetical protein